MRYYNWIKFEKTQVQAKPWWLRDSVYKFLGVALLVSVVCCGAIIAILGLVYLGIFLYVLYH